MLKGKTNGRPGSNTELRTAAELGGLLRAAAEPPELMPWSRVEQLVASAPPVKVPWWSTWAIPVARQLRYALALFMVVGLSAGTLAMMPAHSDFVGTLVLTEMPTTWSPDGPALNEVRSVAETRFAELAHPQSELYIMVGERAGRDELAFVLMGVPEHAARGFIDELQGKYPALSAFATDYSPIESGRFGSRLNELAYSISHRGALEQLPVNELKSHVLKSLGNSGFGVENIEISRRVDGTIVIEVEASIEVAVEMGRTQEELADFGLSKELVGSENYQRLVSEVAAP
ncbi:hypothetical protein JW859_13200 [bacterium]|nr:hypothetical protein [bacterium]